MIRRRPPVHAAAQKSAMSGFDRFTLHAFTLAVTAATAAALAYGPAAALHHIADVIANLPNLPLPDETAWGGQMIF